MKFTWSIAFIASALIGSSSALLTNQEWERIDPEEALSNSKNIKALADYCMEHSARKMMHVLKIWDASTLESKCLKQATQQLEKQHEWILNSEHPYFDGAVRGRSQNYYRTLLLQYALDINDEMPFTLAAANLGRGCQTVANLMGIDVIIGLEIDGAKLVTQREFMHKKCIEVFASDYRMGMTEQMLMVLIQTAKSHGCLHPDKAWAFLKSELTLKVLTEKSIQTIADELIASRRIFPMEKSFDLSMLALKRRKAELNQAKVQGKQEAMKRFLQKSRDHADDDQ